MASTIVGTSGRQYVRGAVIHRNEAGTPTIFKAAGAWYGAARRNSVRHFAYFGPVNEGLLKQVDSDEHITLKKASATAELAVNDQPELRFEVWGKDLGEAALEMISGMTKPDPTARLTIDQVLGSPWWQEP
ncbi:hypothetical protein IFR05_001738 [Cadophora sp. M221]|nr:hypothetical protein IFR05_001738 [Cadophora sp. M221]